VLSDVIGVISSADSALFTARSSHYPTAKAILPRLARCVFSKAENLGRFYDPFSILPHRIIWSWRGLGGAAARPGTPRCTTCNSPPINGQCTNHRIAVIVNGVGIFASRCYASAIYVVMRCPSVCVSVCLSRSWILSKRINVSSKLFTVEYSHAILVFPYQKAWQYSDGNSPNAASNAGGVGRNRDSEPISGFTACCEPFQRQLHLAATKHGEFITLVAGKRPSLLMAGKNDEV